MGVAPSRAPLQWRCRGVRGAAPDRGGGSDHGAGLGKNRGTKNAFPFPQCFRSGTLARHIAPAISHVAAIAENSLSKDIRHSLLAACSPVIHGLSPLSNNSFLSWSRSRQPNKLCAILTMQKGQPNTCRHPGLPHCSLSSKCGSIVSMLLSKHSFNSAPGDMGCMRRSLVGDKCYLICSNSLSSQGRREGEDIINVNVKALERDERYYNNTSCCSGYQ
ncbi:uncharacterized protein LOC143693359 [Agelaius phoeniceus]|uniref:uncharacterized protein LOC143693359 n=1 Tax=Agelaius phoeniceus TaxID=39638 RepID=UPI004054C23F